ncbi:MAG TPA: hydroxyacid dehydrogenase [Hyphomicrobiaceae bacterium]|jgi:(S)-sulfolactate dehydrogenase|nr:hydroxyacid dehydrogenase [Hyphomicrobiaceae bacterium]
MNDIVITEFLEPAAVDLLKKDFSVHWDRELWTKRADLEKLVRDLPALIVRNRTPVDRDLLAMAPRLKVVGRLGVGLDNIDVAECERRGVEVCSARGANATSVSEYAIAMAMTLLRGRAYRDTHRIVAGEWPREELGRGTELAGKTLGIIGLGSIGSTTARKARALDMRVIACDPYLADTSENWNIAERVSLEALLVRADVITIHCPLNEETRGMIAGQELSRVKKGAVLINSARGGIVDEPACAAALKSGQLGGAALDVFDYEPIKAEAGKVFAGIPNVILTPHISGVTLEANHRVSFMTVESVARVLKRGR